MGYMKVNMGGGKGLINVMVEDVICLLTETRVGCVSYINGTAVDGAVYYRKPLTIVYSPKDNFILPDDVTVKMGGISLVMGTDFTWSRVSGILHIPEVRGNVDVTITAYIYGGAYSQVNYIQSSGTQYIDTGLAADQNTAMEAVFAKISTYPAGYWAVFGGCQQDIVKSFLFAMYNNGNTKFEVQAGSNRVSDVNYSFTLNQPYTVKLDKNSTYINGSLVNTLSSYTYTTPVNIGIFKQLYSVSSNCSNAQMRLYGAKMWQSGVLVRYFIPCVRNSDNAAGVFDDVSGTFFPNAGTGSFAYSSNTIGFVNNTLFGCSAAGHSILPVGSPAALTYTPGENFMLPDTITVKMGGVTLRQGTDFTWTQGSGALYIPNVTGDMDVTITAVLGGGLYSQCEYIESGGTQYIDTGIYGSNNTSAEVNFALLNTYPSGWWAVLGACEQDIVKSFLFDIYGSGNTKCNVENGSNRLSDISYSFMPLTRYKVYINKTKTYINDVLEVTLGSYAYTTPVTITLFAQNYSVSTNMNKAQIRMYSCRIWDGENLVRQFIPCVRNSDSAAGMYDAVTGAFFGSIGGGEFGHG